MSHSNVTNCVDIILNGCCSGYLIRVLFYVGLLLAGGTGSTFSYEDLLLLFLDHDNVMNNSRKLSRHL